MRKLALAVVAVAIPYPHHGDRPPLRPGPPDQGHPQTLDRDRSRWSAARRRGRSWPARSSRRFPGACSLRQSFVACVGGHIEQLFNTITSDRCDNAKLCKMGTDRIDH